MTTRRFLLPALLLVASAARLLHAQPARQSQPSRDLYLVSVADVLSINVRNDGTDDKDWSGRYIVQPDGTITMGLLGRVPATQQTVAQFENALTRALHDGFLNNPQVSITLEAYKGRRVFVWGNVGASNMYVLGENETLIQVLAKAGYAKDAAEAVIVRPKHATGQAMTADAGDTEVIRVSLVDLEKDLVERGSLARNLELQDNDTIFVKRFDEKRVFVTGQVRTPGAYSLPEGTTVLQALALAGGPTEQAALNRIKVQRIVKGKQTEVKNVKLTMILLPSDTVIVPERFF
jgi:polysaccharide export outer membrane protein